MAEPHVGSSGDVASRLARFFAFSLPNVPVALAGSPYPVVIYSHGYTFHRQESSEKLEELASHGFVAVAIDHIDCRTTVYPDGTAVRGIFTDPPTQLAIDTAVADRLADDSFVVEALAQLNVNDPLLAGRLDLNQLGAMGWSLGNSDLGQLVQRDVRFKGIVILEGGLQGAPGLLDQLLQHGLRLPLLGMYQEDLSLPPLFNQAVSNATQDTYFTLVHVTSHFAFKDLTELSLANDSVRRGAAAIRACMLSFFKVFERTGRSFARQSHQPVPRTVQLREKLRIGKASRKFRASEALARKWAASSQMKRNSHSADCSHREIPHVIEKGRTALPTENNL